MVTWMIVLFQTNHAIPIFRFASLGQASSPLASDAGLAQNNILRHRNLFAIY